MKTPRKVLVTKATTNWVTVNTGSTDGADFLPYLFMNCTGQVKLLSRMQITKVIMIQDHESFSRQSIWQLWMNQCSWPKEILRTMVALLKKMANPVLNLIGPQSNWGCLSQIYTASVAKKVKTRSRFLIKKTFFKPQKTFRIGRWMLHVKERNIKGKWDRMYPL